ncbi:hypothetical protein H4582DRAFT_2078108 [Lactarius indigo]|nr:hypothetical protein H4582DRAFT_2078108 [Lactarius indigo]
MSLRLPSKSELVGQSESSGGGEDKGKMQCTSSYYPGRGDGSGDNFHDLSLLDPNNHNTDGHIETTEDWMGDEPVAKPAWGAPSKFSEAVKNEQPSWQGLGYVTESILADQSPDAHINDPSCVASGSGLSVSIGATSVHVPLLKLESNDSATVLSVAAPMPDENFVNPTTTPESSRPVAVWPANMNLLFTPGSKKVMLTLQYPLVHSVLQDAIEYMQAYLMLTDAFPDTTDAISFACNSLMTAAKGNQCDTTTICERLQQDAKYLAHLLPVICSTLTYETPTTPLTKERCGMLCIPQICALGPSTEIAHVIQKQLNSYNYTFLYAMLGIAAPDGIPRHTRPYQNDRIILVIQDLYFAGGTSSFATHFEDQFPTHQGPNGVISQEVLILMVALVTMALYATLYEWCTGEQQVTEFSANTYLDIYLGHVNTLNHISVNQEGVYHIMMVDIFAQANHSLGNMNPAQPIAELDLEALE